MPQAASRTNTDTSSEAQARFVVSLPKEVGTQIDKLIGQTQAKLVELGVPGIAISRAAMVQTLVQDALKARDGN